MYLSCEVARASRCAPFAIFPWWKNRLSSHAMHASGEAGGEKVLLVWFRKRAHDGSMRCVLRGVGHARFFFSSQTCQAIGDSCGGTQTLAAKHSLEWINFYIRFALLSGQCPKTIKIIVGKVILVQQCLYAVHNRHHSLHRHHAPLSRRPYGLWAASPDLKWSHD